MRSIRTLSLTTLGLLALVGAGCIGTDFLNEPAERVEPYILITPETSAIVIGESVAYEATYFDSTDTPVAVPIAWTSSNSERVQIGDDGVAVGVSAGQARIVAMAGGVASPAALLTVVGDPNAIARVDVLPGDTTIGPTASLFYQARAFNLSGEPLAVGAVAWSSSDPEVATITDAGLARAVMPGSASIVAMIEGIESAPSVLTVRPPSRTGTFRPRAGTSYDVRGMAVLEMIENGASRLRFGDDFSSSAGPDLYVYLSSGTSVNATSYQVGRLQNLSGAQSYIIPPDVDVDTMRYVIIHCLPFNVSFGFAPLN